MSWALFLIYVGVLVCTFYVVPYVGRRPLMAVSLPLFALDCGMNVIVEFRLQPVQFGSFNGTLSATAWRVREHRIFGWTYKFIDTLFGVGHCARQQRRETTFDGAWGAWLADWRGL